MVDAARTLLAAALGSFIGGGWPLNGGVVGKDWDLLLVREVESIDHCFLDRASSILEYKLVEADQTLRTDRRMREVDRLEGVFEA